MRGIKSFFFFFVFWKANIEVIIINIVIVIVVVSVIIVICQFNIRVVCLYVPSHLAWGHQPIPSWPTRGESNLRLSSFGGVNRSEKNNNYHARKYTNDNEGATAKRKGKKLSLSFLLLL